MVVTCVIEFDNNPYCTYYAGQIITGKVTLQAHKPKLVNSVVLKIHGFAYTRWSESSGSGNDSSSTTYTGREEYIKSKTFLLGPEENRPSLIEPGIHTYTFACHLPNRCPSSFEGHYGHIRYMVKVELERPWKFNQTYTKGFTVLKVLDLNYESPLLRVPTQSEAEKTYCCGPCKSQPLNLQVSLPQAGYVPGQAIAVKVFVSNETHKKVEELQIELVMLVCCYSKSPLTKTKNERIIVTKSKSAGVPVYSKKLLNYPLIVPATPPTCFNLCSIIQIGYEVQVTAKVKGMHISQVVSVPVTVGNVPLMAVIQKQPVVFNDGQNFIAKEGVAAELPSDETELGSVDGFETKRIRANILSTKSPSNNSLEPAESLVMPPTPPTPWAEDANIPLPTYEMAMHMKPAKINADEKHDYGEIEFTPRYPVFKIPSPSIDCVDTVDTADNATDNGDSVTMGDAAKTSTWL